MNEHGNDKEQTGNSPENSDHLGQVKRLVMLCDGCLFKGVKFEHLKGSNGVDEWHHCKYPVPFWVVSKSTPSIPLEGNKCKTRLIA